MNKQPNSRYCLVCGVQNPIGLRVRFYDDGPNRVVAYFQPKEEHQGFPGVLHGGITSALLDETIGRVLTSNNVWAMTTELQVRFLKQIPLDQPLTVVGELVRLRSRMMEGRGEVRLADGSVAATGQAKYILLSEEQTERFRDELGYWQVIPDEDEQSVTGENEQDE